MHAQTNTHTHASSHSEHNTVPFNILFKGSRATEGLFPVAESLKSNIFLHMHM